MNKVLVEINDGTLESTQWLSIYLNNLLKLYFTIISQCSFFIKLLDKSNKHDYNVQLELRCTPRSKSGVNLKITHI